MQNPSEMTVQADSRSAPLSASDNWEKKASQKRARAREAIPRNWLLSAELLDSLQYPLEDHDNKFMDIDIPQRSGILTEAEIQITEAYGVSTLLEKLASGDLSAVEVTLAFSKRAAIAQQLVLP